MVNFQGTNYFRRKLEESGLLRCAECSGKGSSDCNNCNDENGYKNYFKSGGSDSGAIDYGGL